MALDLGKEYLSEFLERTSSHNFQCLWLTVLRWGRVLLLTFVLFFLNMPPNIINLLISLISSTRIPLHRDSKWRDSQYTKVVWESHSTINQSVLETESGPETDAKERLISFDVGPKNLLKKGQRPEDHRAWGWWGREEGPGSLERSKRTGQRSSCDKHCSLLFSPAGPESSDSSSGVGVKGARFGGQDACETEETKTLHVRAEKKQLGEAWFPGEGRASVIQEAAGYSLMGLGRCFALS